MDYFYNAEKEESITKGPGPFQEIVQYSDPAIYLKVTSVLFVRAGLFLSHVSSIPSSNIQILIFQNIIDIAVNTVIYAVLGYLFAFGKDVGQFIGIEGFLADKSNRNDFAEGWIIIIAVSGLLAAAIGDRISFFASLVLNLLISGIVFPIMIHWILFDTGWMRANALNRVRVSYKDYSYSGLIHMGGGFLAFISMLILNKRLLRFKDMDVCSIPDNGPSLTLFGNFFMIIGYFGIGIPTEKYILSHLNYNFYGIVLINMLLSAFGSITSTLLLTFACPCEPMHKWTSMRSIQAGISGVAVVAGGADVYYPMAAILLGVCNGIVFFFVSLLVNKSRIEDYSNIIACHFVSGLIGTLFPPIFGIREAFTSSIHVNFIHFTWQLICDLAILGSVAIVFLPVTFLLDCTSVLRSWDEDINHRRAVFAAKSIKTDSGGIAKQFNYERNDVEVNYATPNYNLEENVNQNPETESSPEGVNVLFEKKPSSTSPNAVEDGRENSSGNYLVQCSSSEKPIADDQYDEEGTKFKREKFLINYVVNSKPLTFFEEIISDSRPASEIVVKECGENMKNPRFFDIRLIKGIRNISDSKLFQKFKENMSAPKRRTTVWNRERELKFGSMSNIWVPKIAEISIETEV